MLTYELAITSQGMNIHERTPKGLEEIICGVASGSIGEVAHPPGVRLLTQGHSVPLRTKNRYIIQLPGYADPDAIEKAIRAVRHIRTATLRPSEMGEFLSAPSSFIDKVRNVYGLKRDAGAEVFDERTGQEEFQITSTDFPPNLDGSTLYLLLGEHLRGQGFGVTELEEGLKVTRHGYQYIPAITISRTGHGPEILFTFQCSDFEEISSKPTEVNTSAIK